MRAILTTPLDWVMMLGVGRRYLAGASEESLEISYLEAEVMAEMNQEKLGADHGCP